VPVEEDKRCVSRRRLLGEAPDDEPTSCFCACYVRWLESAGARVLPIPYDMPRDRIKHILGQVNGLFFTGGDAPVREVRSEYMEVAQMMLEHVVDANLDGTHLPLWGTCMGLQTLSVLVGGPQVLEYHVFQGVDPAMLPLNFTAEAARSQMFGHLPAHIWSWMQTENMTTNYHHDGVDPATFVANPHLAKFFRVTSTNVDGAGKPFVSTIEGKTMPVFAVQWHPERPQFEFLENDPVNHHYEAVVCNAWSAQFFVEEARKNDRRFASAEEERDLLIYNWRPRGRTSKQTYFFSKPK